MKLNNGWKQKIYPKNKFRLFWTNFYPNYYFSVVLSSKVEDKRGNNCSHKLQNILMLGYCVFALKKPSLLSLEQLITVEQANLVNIYGISQVCSDSTVPAVLDGVNPDFLHKHFATKFQTLIDVGIAHDYQLKIG